MKHYTRHSGAHIHSMARHTTTPDINVCILHIPADWMSCLHPYFHSVAFSSIRCTSNAYKTHSNSHHTPSARHRARFSMAIKKRNNFNFIFISVFTSYDFMAEHTIFHAPSCIHRLRMFCYSSHEKRQLHKKRKMERRKNNRQRRRRLWRQWRRPTTTSNE